MGSIDNTSEVKLDLHNKIEIIEVPFVPIQKWFQLVVKINGRSVEIYIDKLLVKYQLLDNVPMLSNNNIILGKKGHNPNIYIGRIEYSPRLLTLNEIRALHFKNMRTLHVSSLYRKKMLYDGSQYLNSFEPSQS